MDAQGLGQSLADGHARVERGIGILEHHLDLAAQRPALAPAADDILAAEVDAALVGCAQPDDEPASVLLPQPDSPTRPKVSPASIAKLTSLTAVSVWPGLKARRAPADERRVALDHALELEDRASHGDPANSPWRMQAVRWPASCATSGGRSPRQPRWRRRSGDGRGSRLECVRLGGVRRSPSAALHSRGRADRLSSPAV